MHYSLKERLKYRFDNVMSKGVVALIGLLGLASLVFVVVIALIVILFELHPEGTQLDFGEALWASLLRTLDPGTMGADRGAGFRAAMLIVTIGGIILVASLISIISNAFNTRIEDLRKGRSRVLETGHTIILGWNSKVIPIIKEVCIANLSQRDSSIVILCDRDKVETEDEIHHKIKHLGKTRIIVRSGDPMSLFDLEIANPQSARSIIILASEEAEDPDSEVIKTALALVNNPHRKTEKYHIVGEIKDQVNLEAARLVGGNEADWVLSSDVISRITVQTSRQSGLSVVFTELLDFEGDEMYFTQQPSLAGKSFIESQLSFATSTVMGILRGSEILLNPSPALLVEQEDILIVISEDDASVKLEKSGEPNRSKIVTTVSRKAPAEKTLILGDNPSLPLILHELNAYAPKGSKVEIVSISQLSNFGKFSNITVNTSQGDTSNRVLLESLDPQQFDHIIVLAYKDTLSDQRADAKTLITLLHLRDIAKLKNKKLNIVTEMMDDRNRQLAEVTDADDFIVSDKLVSLMMAQLSENPRLSEIFDYLFSSEGNEICIKAVTDYVDTTEELDFYTVAVAASLKNETALGYRVTSQSHSSDLNYGMYINPNKRTKIKFSPEDKIIVLSENG